MRSLKLTLGMAAGILVFAGAALLLWPAAAQAQTATPTPAAPADRGLERGGGFGHGRGLATDRLLIEAAAGVTGLTSAEVKTALQSGQSLTQIAQGKNKTAAAVIAAARTLLADQLAQAVTAGKLTQAQADTQLQMFDQNAPTVMADAALGQSQRLGGGPGRGRGHGGGHLGRGVPTDRLLIKATASVTGLTSAEVKTALQSGQSLTQIAQGKNQTAAAVIAAARTQLADQLTQAVTAGKLTQAQADTQLQTFDQNAPTLMDDATLGQRGGGCPVQPPAQTTPTAPGNTSAPRPVASGPSA